MIRHVLLLFLLWASTARAQDELVHEPQAWFGVFSGGPLAGRFVGWFDAHARFAFEPTKTTSILLRPGVGYRVRDDMTVFLGYLWAPVWRDGRQTLDEHRLWQQWTWDIPFQSGARVQVRSRFEERLAQGDVGLRFRQFVRAQTAPLLALRTILVIWDEVFLALNDTRFGQRAGFDQNRLFFGVGYPLTRQLRVEGGYFNQYLPRPAAPDPMRHAAMLNLYVGF